MATKRKNKQDNLVNAPIVASVTKVDALKHGGVIIEEMNIEENTDKQKIAPLIKPVADGHEDLLPPSTGFQPHPGEYHVVALGPGGEEVAGSDFSYPPGKAFEKAFANNPKFNVKKKPRQRA